MCDGTLPLNCPASSLLRSTCLHRLGRVALLGTFLLASAGCTSFAYTNVIKPGGDSHATACHSDIAAPRTAEPAPTRATVNFTAQRGDQDTLFVLALSGGGNRAAYLSAGVMLNLQKLTAANTDLLSQVDVMSAVSGGSLPAAYYAISTDPAEPTVYGRTWDEHTVKQLMTRNYRWRWIGNWFWPGNIAKFWFTAYDRTDIMAQTLADNLFDQRPYGRDLAMRNLRSERPYLLLNATNVTDGSFDEPFTFTREAFDALNSDIHDYSLARAVMATATFPSAFNNMTLANFTKPATEDDHRCAYVHLFDGGNYDNLGLNVVRDRLAHPDADISYRNLVVILVDAFTDSGLSANKADPRTAIDFLIDTNFLSSSDALLAGNRRHTLNAFHAFLLQRDPGLRHTVFYHVRFEDVSGEVRDWRSSKPNPGLKTVLNQIPTDFGISRKNAGYIDQALEQLMSPRHACLQAIQTLINTGSVDPAQCPIREP